MQCYQHIGVGMLVCIIHFHREPETATMGTRLIRYQSLILLASMAYKGNGWQGYDRIFRQNAAVKPSCIWAAIDGPL